MKNPAPTRLAASLAALLAVAALGPAADAQITKAPASPRAQLTQQVGLAEVSIDYSRPGVKGRPIFGGLVAHGQIWRTGANASTKITFDRDVEFGGESVRAGTYALYTIPDETSWTVIVSADTSLWGAGGYDRANDVVRVEVPVTTTAALRESFTIDFDGFGANGADLVMSWEHTEVRVPVFVDSDEVVFQQIREQVLEATGEVPAMAYFDAASFYYEKRHDLPQAAAWMEKAIEGAPQAFWMMYARAEVAHAMGEDDVALDWAKRAHELVTEAPHDYGYLAKTQLLIDKLEGGTR